jgi:hypothetical protein
MSDLSVIFLLFKVENMFKGHSIKSDHTIFRKNLVDAYGASVFAPDYSATCLAAKM